eukprot:4101491-Pleurochrysis_carterae.AAC.1
MMTRSVVLLYRLDSAAPPNNCSGGARPTTIVLAVAARGYGCTSDACRFAYESYHELQQASYSHTTARTVRISDSEPFQSAAYVQVGGEILKNCDQNQLLSRGMPVIRAGPTPLPKESG